MRWVKQRKNEHDSGKVKLTHIGLTRLRKNQVIARECIHDRGNPIFNAINMGLPRRPTLFIKSVGLLAMTPKIIQTRKS